MFRFFFKSHRFPWFDYGSTALRKPCAAVASKIGLSKGSVSRGSRVALLSTPFFRADRCRFSWSCIDLFRWFSMAHLKSVSFRTKIQDVPWRFFHFRLNLHPFQLTCQNIRPKFRDFNHKNLFIFSKKSFIEEALRLAAADLRALRQCCSLNHACPRWGNSLHRSLPGAWLVENGSSNNGFLVENGIVLAENVGFDDCFMTKLSFWWLFPEKVVILKTFSWKSHNCDGFYVKK